MHNLKVQMMTDEEARKYFEELRWPKGPVCVHCESRKVVRVVGATARPGLLRCNKCEKQFTVTVGTIFEGSHISLDIWFRAFHAVCSSKKGISALQLSRMLGVTYKSAWFMAHRIRLVMKGEPFTKMLKGTVEVDETYIGGKPRYKSHTLGRRPFSESGRATVVALVQRGGKTRSHRFDAVSGRSLKDEIRNNVSQTSTIITDDFKPYRGIGRDFKGGHHVVEHSVGEYVRGKVHTNTAESFFALLKRGIMGTFHHVSKQHLNRYLDEFTFRWNTRKVSDGERFQAALSHAAGKRLRYKAV